MQQTPALTSKNICFIVTTTSVADLAEHGLPGRRAATAAQPVDQEISAAPPQQGMPTHSLQPDQPGQDMQAEESGQQASGPADSKAGPSGVGVNDGAMPKSHHAEGTVADPVVISDSDSSEDELEVRNLHIPLLRQYTSFVKLVGSAHSRQKRVQMHKAGQLHCLPHLRKALLWGQLRACSVGLTWYSCAAETTWSEADIYIYGHAWHPSSGITPCCEGQHQ